MIYVRKSNREDYSERLEPDSESTEWVIGKLREMLEEMYA